jgi:hypothetical protein
VAGGVTAASAATGMDTATVTERPQGQASPRPP